MTTSMNEDPFLSNSVSIISQNNGSVLIGYGSFRSFSALHDADKMQPVFFVQDFFMKCGQPWIQYDKWMEISVNDLQLQLKTAILKELKWEINGKNIFNDAFTDLKRLFKAGELKKAVPYVFAEVPDLMTRARLLNSLHHALSFRKIYHGHLYGHWHQGKGFLGFTPEILFEYDFKQPQHLKTMALAGTKNRQGCLDLLNNTKELNEHGFVIEGIRNSLHTLGEIEIGETHILDLPGLGHLLTPIQVLLKEPFDYSVSVNCMHPTPALGAFPTQAGIKWLVDYAVKLDRKSFGAPFGFYHPSNGSALCIVGIRQLQWNLTGMRIGAGCGVIQESIFENEWKEIQLKIKSIRNILSL